MNKHILELANDLETLANKVITEHAELEILKENNIKVGFVRSLKKKKSRNRLTFADTRKVTEPYSIFVPYDFLITFYMPNVSMLNENQIEILMWHELKHCGVDEKGNLYLAPHDIEDFTNILEKHGLHWAETNNTE